MIFIDWFLPGFKAGGPIRSIAHLTEQLPLKFSIVTSIFDHHSSEPYPNITAGEWVQHSPNVRVLYLHPEQCTIGRYRDVIQECSPSKIYLNSLFSLPFALKPLLAAKKEKCLEKVILAPRGMLKSGALKVKGAKKKLFLFLSRCLGLFNGIEWHATNAQEKEEIVQHFGQKQNVHVAANLAAAPQSMLQLQERNDVLKLCTVARVSEEKNLLGGLHLLIDSNVKAEWNIYGVTQNQEYVDLLISLAENHDRIELNLHGEINPNDLSEALKSGHFFYLPTLGENYGHSIVESFMHGIPVIISNKTPWNKLEEKNCGWDLDLSSNDWSKVFQRASSMQDSNYSDMRNAAHEYGKSISKDEKARQAYMAIFGN